MNNVRVNAVILEMHSSPFVDGWWCVRCIISPLSKRTVVSKSCNRQCCCTTLHKKTVHVLQCASHTGMFPSDYTQSQRLHLEYEDKENKLPHPLSRRAVNISKAAEKEKVEKINTFKLLITVSSREVSVAEKAEWKENDASRLKDII